MITLQLFRTMKTSTVSFDELVDVIHHEPLESLTSYSGPRLASTSARSRAACADASTSSRAPPGWARSGRSALRTRVERVQHDGDERIRPVDLHVVVPPARQEIDALPRPGLVMRNRFHTCGRPPAAATPCRRDPTPRSSASSTSRAVPATPPRSATARRGTGSSRGDLHTVIVCERGRSVSISGSANGAAA